MTALTPLQYANLFITKATAGTAIAAATLTAFRDLFIRLGRAPTADNTQEELLAVAVKFVADVNEAAAHHAAYLAGFRTGYGFYYYGGARLSCSRYVAVAFW